jgi:hypothetical protein
MRLRYRSFLALGSTLAMSVAIGGHDIRGVAARSAEPAPTTTSGASAEAMPSRRVPSADAAPTPQPTATPSPEPTSGVTPSPEATPTPSPVGPPLEVDVYAQAEFPCELDAVCTEDPRLGYALTFTGEFEGALVERTEPYDGFWALWGLVLPGTSSGTVGGSFGAALTAGPREVFPVIDAYCLQNRYTPDGEIQEQVPSTVEGQTVTFRLDVLPTDEFVFVDCIFSLNFVVDASPLPTIAIPSVPATLPPTDAIVDRPAAVHDGLSVGLLAILAGAVAEVLLIRTWPKRRSARK